MPSDRVAAICLPATMPRLERLGGKPCAAPLKGRFKGQPSPIPPVQIPCGGVPGGNQTELRPLSGPWTQAAPRLSSGALPNRMSPAAYAGRPIHPQSAIPSRWGRSRALAHGGAVSHNRDVCDSGDCGPQSCTAATAAGGIGFRGFHDARTAVGEGGAVQTSVPCDGNCPLAARDRGVLRRDCAPRVPGRGLDRQGARHWPQHSGKAACA